MASSRRGGLTSKGWVHEFRDRPLPVLPERKRYPNLASRVLGLCLQRLSAD